MTGTILLPVVVRRRVVRAHCARVRCGKRRLLPFAGADQHFGAVPERRQLWEHRAGAHAQIHWLTRAALVTDTHARPTRFPWWHATSTSARRAPRRTNARHRPDGTVLYALVEEYIEAFFARLREQRAS